jgi:hypothetical protein
MTAVYQFFACDAIANCTRSAHILAKIAQQLPLLVKSSVLSQSTGL